MERVGLVAQLEAELERRISLGLVPEDGELPSERTLASKYGVSRTTAREALVQLRARGLVQVHPGRRARTVVMEEAIRLENLGTALLGEGSSHPERQALLAGYLELKREVTVELLAACCEKASEEELEMLLPSPYKRGGRARFAQSGPVVIPVCARCQRGALLPRLAGLLALASARAGAVGERHHHHGQERGQRLLEALPRGLHHTAQHHRPHRHQRWRRSHRRDRREQRELAGWPRGCRPWSGRLGQEG